MQKQSLIAAIYLITIGAAYAQSLPASSAQNSIDAEPSRYAAVSGSVDADSLGNRSVDVAATFAPFSSIDESGIRFQLAGDISWYRYAADDNSGTLATGRSQEIALLSGYGISMPRLSVNLLTGVAFGEIANPGETTDRWGAKVAISFYATPTDRTMASGWATYSTIANSLQAQAKIGLKIFGDVYVGPETKFSWRQILPWEPDLTAITLTAPVPTFATISPRTSVASMRFGAHISALRIGPTSIGVSGGWTQDRELGDGYYGSASVYLPF
jgi:hypothetical protein